MNWGDFMSKVLNNLGYDLKAQERILNSHAVNRYSLHTLEKEDVVIAISASGSSKSIITAVFG